MAISAASKGRVIVLTGLAVAVAAGAAVLRTDLLLTRGFGHALEAARPAFAFDAASAKEPQGRGAAVGDEGYWLTRAEVESPTPFAKALAVGDRITIAGGDGRERRLEVLDLKVISGSTTGGARSAPMRLLLVTCRVTGDAAGPADAPVRFIIEAEPAPSATPAPAKAL